MTNAHGSARPSKASSKSSMRFNVPCRSYLPAAAVERRSQRPEACRPSPHPQVPRGLLARADLRPEYLTALWRAAIKLGLLRVSAGAVEVFTQGVGIGPAARKDDWLWALAEDPARSGPSLGGLKEEFRGGRAGSLAAFPRAAAKSRREEVPAAYCRTARRQWRVHSAAHGPLRSARSSSAAIYPRIGPSRSPVTQT